MVVAFTPTMVKRTNNDIKCLKRETVAHSSPICIFGEMKEKARESQQNRTCIINLLTEGKFSMFELNTL